MKKEYVAPALDIISLATIQETMQAASMKARGANVTFETSTDFDSYFK